jgi:proliferating cell nuclear antigen
MIENKDELPKLTMDSKTLGKLLKMVASITSEVRFRVSPSNLKIAIVDPVNVALGAFELTGPEYELNRDGPCEFCIDVDDLRKILKTFKFNGPCTFVIEDDKTTFLCENKLFDVTLDPTTVRADPRVPIIENPIEFTYSPGELNNIMVYCTEESDHVEFEYEHNVIEITSKNDKGKLVFKTEIPTELDIMENKHSMFSLDYLADITSSLKYQNEWICDEVTLTFGRDFPLIIMGNVSDNFTFKFLLAPRIEG